MCKAADNQRHNGGGFLAGQNESGRTGVFLRMARMLLLRCALFLGEMCVVLARCAWLQKERWVKGREERAWHESGGGS